jgi:hypothetical protein
LKITKFRIYIILVVIAVVGIIADHTINGADYEVTNFCKGGEMYYTMTWLETGKESLPKKKRDFIGSSIKC